MDPALKRRLDALIVLCAALLGLVITALAVGPMTGIAIVAVSVLPTFAILVVVYAALDRAESGTPATE